MTKAKLTLYVDEDVSELAHKTAKLSGQSISRLVQNFFLRKGRMMRETEISPSISAVAGTLRTKKTYSELRDELVQARLDKYEGLD